MIDTEGVRAMTETRFFESGVSRHIGTYSDAVRIPSGADQVLLSGTPGLRPDGSIPEEFSDEARQAWENVRVALDSAGAKIRDIVQVRTWLTSADDLEAYVRVRNEFITHKPAYMLAVVPRVIWSTMRLEIEVLAAVVPESASAGRDE